MAKVQVRSDQSPVERALAWIDAETGRLGPEEVRLGEASGRVLAQDLYAADPLPAGDCAALDGFAVRASETVGAGAYNPLTLAAPAVAAGDALPEGADAVVPLEHAQPEEEGSVVLVEPVAAGRNVHRRGAAAEAGSVLARSGTRLAPCHLGLLAAAGLSRLMVVRQPRVRIAVAGSVRPGTAADSDGPMIRALVARDGGVVAVTGLDHAFGAGADIVLTIGGTGPGRADETAAALAHCGEVSIHGLRLRPGGTAGFGRTAAGTAVVLLPGAPPACLWTYELFAGRAIRRLGGRDPRLPYRRRLMTTARKIVSAIGVTEICAVRCRPDAKIEPLASFAEIGLMAAVEADGFAIVPDTSEGYPAGMAVEVYLYDKLGGSQEARP